MDSDQDRRHRLRVPFTTPVAIRYPDPHQDQEQEMDAVSRDIGMLGIYLQSDSPLSLHTPCAVDIRLHGRTSRLHVTVEGQVSRVDEDGFAVSFHNDLEWWAIFPIFSAYGGVPVTNRSEKLTD